MKPYTEIADRIALRIATGELPLGARLPPQRDFAHTEGIAVSTASRVYEELRRRGLVVGEVGRGTFVANRFRPLDPALQEPSGRGIDLDIVFRLSAEGRDRIAASTARFFRQGLEQSAVAPSSASAEPSVASVFAETVGSTEHPVSPNSLVLVGNGKQAISTCLAALAPRGGRIGVETMTYPYVRAAARQLGIDLVPLSMDAEGVTPVALDRAAQTGLQGVYLQPTLQSPLVLTMSEDRKQCIADVLKRHRLSAIEDRIYSFLKPTVPLAAYAPNHVIRIDSLSKRLMPGLSLGIIAPPEPIADAIRRAARSGGWMAQSLAVQLARHWIEDGTVASVETSKRHEARQMFDVAARTLAGLDFSGAPEALHGWLTLPKGWRSEAFAAACAEIGIAVAPGSAFAVVPGAAPSGVRIAFSANDLTIWTHALRAVARIAKSAPTELAQLASTDNAMASVTAEARQLSNGRST
ncbi:putative HTH-type transcriptional regulator YdcR (plasmid) [Sulfitobacter sp. THAF37]|uniref:aminotransferase-like domain-containing protein n=1 Tax=Sulfitobacter sp. THAF37 TaxID=2587855 RepID=UPI001267CF83|nr:PLP-dependent aminotransferase family protein [Sulfitobacter sp. THAF37]QFT60970.1 putative HTH-type transcriptional regulator YdcR [Sulfitobacter sp. THAF37]